MENDSIQISKNYVFISLFSALLIVIFHNLDIGWYLANIILPFSILLVSNILIYKDSSKINKKAYWLLIPILLILWSDPIIHIDISNQVLNVIFLPILIAMFFFLLTNQFYHISFRNFSLVFKLFPTGIFHNLTFLTNIVEKGKGKKVLPILTGIGIGAVLSSIILFLLVMADDYFEVFIHNISSLFQFDFGNIKLFIISFIILFSISVNILKMREVEIEQRESYSIDKIIIITILFIVDLIFVLFLFSEISKLCGNFLKIPKGYIYSSYAREGFFELFLVSSINYAIISFTIYRTKDMLSHKTVRILLLLLIIFSVLLIFNSYYRMFLYIGHYGFTILRLQVVIFLAMEFILFGLIAKKIICGLKNDAFLYFLVMTSFYIINLYLCNDFFVHTISNIF